MKSYGLTLLLKDDPTLIEQYKAYHRNVWPEVLRRLCEVGILRMQIFLLGRRMFMYIDTTDDFEPARDFARVNEDPRSAEWDRLMRTLQERAPEAREGEWWALMECVFDTEWPQHKPYMSV